MSEMKTLKQIFHDHGFPSGDRIILPVKEWLQQKRQEHIDVHEVVYFIQRAYLKIFDELLEELKKETK